MHKASNASRLQSAMEYLMTYGWSILIIAIVLAAVFELGVFSNGNLSPKAPVNSCRVSRPYGASSTASLNLQGVCNNEPPTYVALFNGVTSNIVVPYSPSVNFANSLTVVAWINPYQNNTYNEFIIGSQNPSTRNWKLGLAPGGPLRLDLYTGGGLVEFDEAIGGNFNPNTWYQVAATFNGVQSTLYINGVSIGSSSFSANTIYNAQNPLSIGQDQAITSRLFSGLMSNMQVYNTALDPTSIQALYQEGIGGAPISLQSLVAWWPLNGDTNDYSGEGNNGVPTSLVFMGSWNNGYTTP